MSLQDLLKQPGIWRGRRATLHRPGSLATGWAELDRRIPDGWPRGSLSEILTSAAGSGELALIMPALRQLSSEGRRIACVAPPHLPYPPAWHQQGIELSRLVCIECQATDVLWTAEQILRSATCGAVLCWPGQPDDRALRRLQLAAEQGQCHSFIFRLLSARRQSSPAAMRVQVEPWGQIQVIKRRGMFVDGSQVAIG